MFRFTNLFYFKQVSSSFEKLDYNVDQLDDGSMSDFISDEANDVRLQQTMLVKAGNDSRRRGESKDRLSSVGDHIYEEPSGLVALMKSSAPQSQRACFASNSSNFYL